MPELIKMPAIFWHAAPRLSDPARPRSPAARRPGCAPKESFNEELTAAGWGVTSEATALRKLHGTGAGRKVFEVKKGELGVVVGMTQGKLVVRFSSGIVRVDDSRWVERPSAAAGPEDKPKKCVVPKGFEFLKAGGGETIKIWPWVAQAPSKTTEMLAAALVDRVRVCIAAGNSLQLAAGNAVTEDHIAIVERDGKFEAFS